MWNYRIIKDEETYGLHEVFYNDDGEIALYTERADAIGESVEDLIKSLEMMMNDVKRCKDDILIKDEIVFHDLYDKSEDLIEVDFDEFISELDNLIDEDVDEQEG